MTTKEAIAEAIRLTDDLEYSPTAGGWRVIMDKLLEEILRQAKEIHELDSAIKKLINEGSLELQVNGENIGKITLIRNLKEASK